MAYSTPLVRPSMVWAVSVSVASETSACLLQLSAAFFHCTTYPVMGEPAVSPSGVSTYLTDQVPLRLLPGQNSDPRYCSVRRQNSPALPATSEPLPLSEHYPKSRIFRHHL